MKNLNLTGKKFGRLTAIEPREGRNWLFSCDCGALIEKRASNVKYGTTKSCGCLRSRVARSPLYPNAKKPLGNKMRDLLYNELVWQGKSIKTWSVELDQPPNVVIRRLFLECKL